MLVGMDWAGKPGDTIYDAIRCAHCVCAKQSCRKKAAGHVHEINFQGSRMKDAKDGGGVALFLIQHDIAHKMQSGRGRFTVQCDFNGSNGMAVAKGLLRSEFFSLLYAFYYYYYYYY